ncbi:MAG: GTPase Era [Rhodospirillaceae bacterium]|jgi:GTP-binding protein Era|nr:GTPase Era [Rhodospirillaceae bacterium]
MSAPENMHCGYVAVLGAPNAGKSTLVNRLVGAKVTIVSPKVQTTRNRVLGIAVSGDAQIVFIDTPGIFTPKKRFDRAMVAAAWGGAKEADVVVLMVDAKSGFDKDTRIIVDGLEKYAEEGPGEGKRRPVFLVLNKIDLVKPEALLALTQRLHDAGKFDHTFMISALSGEGVDDLMAAILPGLPKGHWLFPEDQLSDMPQRLLAAEITREQVFLQLHQELPYAIAVETEAWENFDNGDVKIDQVVYVQRDSQKGIVLGKGGSRIKEIGAQARAQLETMLDCKVHLFLRVKKHDKWSEDPRYFRALGLDYNA